MSGNTIVASAYTLTGRADRRIFPHDIASSGLRFVSDIKRGGITLTHCLQGSTIPCTRVGAVKLLTRVDKHREIGPVTHQVGVADMVFHLFAVMI